MSAGLSPTDRRFIIDNFQRISAIPIDKLTATDAGWLLNLRRNLGLAQVASLDEISIALISDHLKN